MAASWGASLPSTPCLPGVLPPPHQSFSLETDLYQYSPVPYVSSKEGPQASLSKDLGYSRSYTLGAPRSSGCSGPGGENS